MIYTINFNQNIISTYNESFQFEFETEFFTSNLIHYATFNDTNNTCKYFDNNQVEIKPSYTSDFQSQINTIITKLHELFDNNSLDRAKQRKLLDLNIYSEFENYINTQNIIASSLGFNIYGDKHTEELLKTNSNLVKTLTNDSVNLEDDELQILLNEFKENYQNLANQKASYVEQINNASSETELNNIQFNFSNLDFTNQTDEENLIRQNVIQSNITDNTLQELKDALILAILGNDQEQIAMLQEVYSELKESLTQE